MKREFERESLFIFLILGKSQGPKKSLKDFIFIMLFLFCFFVTSLLVSIELPLPMFLLTCSSAVKDTVTSFAWSEFVF